MNTTKTLMATAVLVVLFFQVILVQHAEADEMSIVVLDDSYVKSDEPYANKGNSSNLYTYKHELELRSIVYGTWLKFNLSETPSEATVYSIILRLHTSLTSSNTTNRVGVFLCDNSSWTEIGIAWDNAPPVSRTQPLQTIDVNASDKYYDFELTAALYGKSVVSLVLETIEPTGPLQWAIFDSKEGTYAPRLIVEYAVQFHAGQPDPVFPVFIIVIIVAVTILSATLALLRFRATRKKRIPKQRRTPLHRAYLPR